MRKRVCVCDENGSEKKEAEVHWGTDSILYFVSHAKVNDESL